jgi:hypothetical protein
VVGSDSLDATPTAGGSGIEADPSSPVDRCPFCIVPQAGQISGPICSVQPLRLLRGELDLSLAMHWFA